MSVTVWDEYVAYDEMMRCIDEIKQGDIVYVVSDVLQLSLVCREHGVKPDLNRFIDSILEKVGPEGTVLIPTFHWGFCKGETFDVKKTVSKTGALGNAALKRADFKRSKHPIYSFVIWGKDQEQLTQMDPKDAFGPGTIFEYMHQNNAKALVIGLPTMSGLTFCHYVEQCVGVPYRYLKDFTAGYIDENGVETQKTYSMYVRDLEMDPRHIDGFRPLGDILEQLNVSVSYQMNGIGFHVVDLPAMYEVTRIDIEHNDSRNMYVYQHK